MGESAFLDGRYVGIVVGTIVGATAATQLPAPSFTALNNKSAFVGHFDLTPKYAGTDATRSVELTVSSLARAGTSISKKVPPSTPKNDSVIAEGHVDDTVACSVQSSPTAQGSNWFSAESCPAEKMAAPRSSASVK